MKGQTRPVGALRSEAGAVRSELSTLASRLETLRRRMEQLSALRDEERDVAARVAELERVLDFTRVAAHVRSAARESPLVAEPVPHLIVSNLLPADAYRAVMHAIPASVLLDGRAERGQEVRVPPRLAPTTAIITWTFLNEVGRVLSDVLVERLAEPLAAHARRRFPSLPPADGWGVEITLSEARIVRRIPGYQGGSPADRPWDLLTGVLYLGRHQDTAEYGSRLHGAAIPFRANSLLACAGAADIHAYASIPRDAPADTERYSYEFGIGPTKDARRTLTALMKSAT